MKIALSNNLVIVSFYFFNCSNYSDLVLIFSIVSIVVIYFLQRALKEYVGSLDPTYAKESKEFYVGFEGSFGARHVTARTLTSRHINNLVMILFDNSIITIYVELKVLEVFAIKTLDVKTKVDGREFTTVDSF